METGKRPESGTIRFLEPEAILHRTICDLWGPLKAIGRHDLLEASGRNVVSFSLEAMAASAGSALLVQRSITCRLVGKALCGLGKFADATVACQVAELTAHRALAQAPGDPTALEALALALDLTGDLSFNRGKADLAQLRHEEARVLWKKMAKRTVATEEGLAVNGHLLGRCFWRRRALDSALGFQTEAVNSLRRLSGDMPWVPSLAGELAAALGWMANTLRDQGKLDEAVDCTRESHRIRRELHLMDPLDMLLQSDCIWSVGNLGLLLAAKGQLVEARALLEANLADQKELLRRQPDNTEFVNTAHFHGGLLCDLFLYGDDVEKAHEFNSLALEYCFHSSQRDAGVFRSNQMCFAMTRFAEISFAKDEVSVAQVYAAQAIEAGKVALNTDPANTIYIKAFCRALVADACIRRKARASAISQKRFEEAANYCVRYKPSPDDPLDNHLLAATLIGCERVREAEPVLARMAERGTALPILRWLCREFGLELIAIAE